MKVFSKFFFIALVSLGVALLSVILHNLFSLKFGESSSLAVIFFFLALLAILAIIVNIFLALIFSLKKKH